MVKNFYCSFLVPATSTSNATKKLVCSCGKNNKEAHISCVQDANGRTHCRCIGKGVSCSRIAAAQGVERSKRTKNPKRPASRYPVNVESTKLNLMKSMWHAATANEKQSAPRCLCKNCGNCGTSSLNLFDTKISQKKTWQSFAIQEAMQCWVPSFEGNTSLIWAVDYAWHLPVTRLCFFNKHYSSRTLSAKYNIVI